MDKAEQLTGDAGCGGVAGDVARALASRLDNPLTVWRGALLVCSNDASPTLTMLLCRKLATIPTRRRRQPGSAMSPPQPRRASNLADMLEYLVHVKGPGADQGAGAYFRTIQSTKPD